MGIAEEFRELMEKEGHHKDNEKDWVFSIGNPFTGKSLVDGFIKGVCSDCAQEIVDAQAQLVANTVGMPVQAISVARKENTKEAFDKFFDYCQGFNIKDAEKFSFLMLDHSEKGQTEITGIKL